MSRISTKEKVTIGNKPHAFTQKEHHPRQQTSAIRKANNHPSQDRPQRRRPPLHLGERPHVYLSRSDRSNGPPPTERRSRKVLEKIQDHPVQILRRDRERLRNRPRCIISQHERAEEISGNKLRSEEHTSELQSLRH